MDINDRRITEVKCTLCSPPIYTILKWCGSTSAAEKHRKRVEKTHSALLVMLLTCAFAFNVVSNPQFTSFVQMLNPTYEVPSSILVS